MIEVQRPGEAVFISDLHLADPETPEAKRLLRFVQSLAHRPVSSLFLVGDIFDFWLGYSGAIYSQFFPFLRALAELVEAGVEVVLFPGNHDPDPGPFFDQIGVRVQHTPLVRRFGERQVWIDHGDREDVRGSFKRFVCRAVHQPTLLKGARAIHPSAAAWAAGAYGRWLGGEDRTADYTLPLPEHHLDAWWQSKIEQGHEVLVMGHYHKALARQRDHQGRSQSLFILGDWLNHFTWLRYHEGEFTLMRDQGPDQPAQPLGWGLHPLPTMPG
ncbi:MAG: UDP-2,3-diacylglucosamine diphosphatase [Bradymonadia bacterium]